MFNIYIYQNKYVIYKYVKLYIYILNYIYVYISAVKNNSVN